MRPNFALSDTCDVGSLLKLRRQDRRPLFRPNGLCCSLTESGLPQQLKLDMKLRGHIISWRRVQGWVFFPLGLQLDLELSSQLLRLDIKLQKSQCRFRKLKRLPRGGQVCRPNYGT
jgi:hypothetical protein